MTKVLLKNIFIKISIFLVFFHARERIYALRTEKIGYSLDFEKIYGEPTVIYV